MRTETVPKRFSKPRPRSKLWGRVVGQIRRIQPRATRLPGIITHINRLSSNFSAKFQPSVTFIRFSKIGSKS